MKLPKIVVDKEKMFWLAFTVVIGFSFLFSVVINFQSNLVSRDFVLSFFNLFFNVLYVIFFWSFVTVIIVVAFVFFIKENDRILDNCLLPLIRKYKALYFWTTLNYIFYPHRSYSYFNLFI